METNRLKAFCTLVETGNMRKAADLLSISHSGLSKSMQVLQDELHLVLFQASGRGIVVTDAGQELYRRSKSFFTELDQLLDQKKTSSPQVLRIGSFEVFTSYLMGSLVQTHFPEAALEIHELIPGRLEEALALGRIDMGLTYDPIPRPGIDFKKITSVRMGAYARVGRFQNTDFEKIPFVVPANPLEGSPSGVKGLDAWPKSKTQRLVRYRVDLMETGLALARQGLCAIFIPDFIAQLHNSDTLKEKCLKKISIPKVATSVSREVYLVKRESTIEDSVTRRFAQAIRQICAD